MKLRRELFALSFRAIAVASLTVTLFAPSSSAQAALFTRNIDVTLNALTSQTFNLDVDRNNTTDFTFSTAFDPGFPLGFAVVTVPLGSISNGVAIASQPLNGFPPARRLGVGDAVGISALFSDLNDQANLFSLIGGPEGNFGGQSGFIGLRFDGDSGPLLGFAQIFVAGLGSANPFDLTIGTVGFNNVVGQAFAIPSVVAEPGSLSLLAFASLGLFAVHGRTRRSLRDGVSRAPLLGTSI